MEKEPLLLTDGIKPAESDKMYTIGFIVTMGIIVLIIGFVIVGAYTQNVVKKQVAGVKTTQDKNDTISASQSAPLLSPVDEDSSPETSTTPTPTATSTPTYTPAPTSSPTPSPTPTSIPTPTDTPTSTPTNTPTQTP